MAHLEDFNPRPRVEGDRGSGANGLYADNFNPRPRVEGDADSDRNQRTCKEISILALVWRATDLYSL